MTFTGITNADGGFTLDFIQQEFELIDSNQNGLLDPQEGVISGGGIDSTTNQSFSGSLSADANSSVITPLTTIVSELILWEKPEDAQAKVGISLDSHIM